MVGAFLIKSDTTHRPRVRVTPGPRRRIGWSATRDIRKNSTPASKGGARQYRRSADGSDGSRTRRRSSGNGRGKRGAERQCDARRLQTRPGPLTPKPRGAEGRPVQKTDKSGSGHHCHDACGRSDFLALLYTCPNAIFRFLSVSAFCVSRSSYSS